LSTTPSVVFIGSPTRDLVIRGGTTQEVTGGAAFISALACRWAGASTGVVARVPTVLPTTAEAVFGEGGLNRGGLTCADGALPGFTITYDTDDRATYSQMRMGLETDLCAADIPEGWMTAACSWIHIAGIGASPAQQWTMLNNLRARFPEWCGTISVGTCRAMIEADREHTLQLLGAADVFFLNLEEFGLLCPEGAPSDTMLVVTKGPDGVDIWRDGQAEHHPAQPAQVVDPTGAGDAFCGGFIGSMVTNAADAIHTAASAASHTLEGLGAAPLSHWVAAQVRSRADDDAEQLARMAPLIQDIGQAAAFDFAAPPHLPASHPMALQMLSIATLHQFGFWTASVTGGWEGPMIAELDGQRYKGSDFIWAAFARAARHDPDALSFERMAQQHDLFAEICRADDGTCPVPDLVTHQELHMAHAITMQRIFPGGYESLLERANRSPTPIATFLSALESIPGYDSDPLAKKANLLAVILAARPEHFLDARDPENIAPIVDYHMMRLCLRTGLVKVQDPDLERRLSERMWVDTIEEMAIREATGRAILRLVEGTSCSVADIDGLLFRLGRTVCLETTEPECSACPLVVDCGQHTQRFQPVYRTQAY